MSHDSKKTLALTLNEALKAKGFTTQRASAGRKDILKGRTVVLKNANADQVWKYLRTGKKPPQVKTSPGKQWALYDTFFSAGRRVGLYRTPEKKWGAWVLLPGGVIGERLKVPSGNLRSDDVIKALRNPSRASVKKSAALAVSRLTPKQLAIIKKLGG